MAIAFVDLEASGLQGFPIELGWAVVGDDDYRISAGSVLIRHEPWLEQVDLWDTEAQAVHRIQRAALMAYGIAPATVIAHFEAAVAGAALFADDGQPYDQKWLAQLYAAAGREDCPQVQDWSHVFSGLDTDEIAFDSLLSRGEIEAYAPHTHRAGDDALALAVVYVMTRRHVIAPPGRGRREYGEVAAEVLAAAGRDLAAGTPKRRPRRWRS